MVSDLESQIAMLTIIVTLLTRLRGFEIITDDFTHFFNFYDQVVAKKLAFTSLRPIERSTALSAIEHLEWGLARTRLEAVVVGELGIWRTIFQSIPNEITEARSMSFHPQTSGQVEQVNQILDDMLRACVISFSMKWEGCLPYAEFSYNNSFQASSGKAPFEILYGTKCRTPLNW